MGEFGAEHATALMNFAKNTIGIQEGLEGLVTDIQRQKPHVTLSYNIKLHHKVR